METKTRVSQDFPIALGATVICLSAVEEQKTAGGIIIPETSEQMTNTAIVQSVGVLNREFVDTEGNKRKLQVGDRIIHNTYANLIIMHKSTPYLVLSELDIYGVIPPDTIMGTKKFSSRKKTNDQKPKK